MSMRPWLLIEVTGTFLLVSWYFLLSQGAEMLLLKAALWFLSVQVCKYTTPAPKY